MSPAANIKASTGITAVCRGQGAFHGAPSCHGDGSPGTREHHQGHPSRGWSLLSQCHCSWVRALQLLCSQPRLMSPVLQPGRSSWAGPRQVWLVPGSVPPRAWHCPPAPQPGCAHRSSHFLLSVIWAAPEGQLSMKSLMFKGSFG